MSKTKLDFKTLKLDYLTSDEMEVKTFIEKKLGAKRNGNLQRNTNGRRKEKEDYLNKIFSKALEDSEKDLEERLKAKIIKVENLYFQLTLTLEERLKNPEALNISDLYTIRKIIRTEKNLPINITNANIKEEKENKDELSEEDEEALRVLVEANFRKDEDYKKARKFEELGLTLQKEDLD